MSNETHDPHAPGTQAPGHGTGAPQGGSNDATTTAAGATAASAAPGPTAQRDAATAEYGQQAGAPDHEVDPAAAQAALIKGLQDEIADLKDQVLRAFAEVDNVRKRAERERQDTQKYAVSKFARDMLSVADNLERALAAVPSDTADPILKGLLDGVTVTERGLAGVLERYGVKRIPAEGAPFDPHQHQAVMEHQDPGVPNGTVVRVFEAGYTIEDRVLRPASVVVAKGGPKADKATTPQSADATAAASNLDAENDAQPGNSNSPNGNNG